MSNEKPRIFIGSSLEGIRIAHAIQENLEHDALCSIWNQGTFGLSESTLENLIKSLDRFQFGVFVFQPDDLTQIRDETRRTVRDNVILEFGLFLGRLGKDRVFFLMPRGVEEMHLPSDLLGIQPGHYDVPNTDQDLRAVVGPFCNQVRRKLSVDTQAKKDTGPVATPEDQSEPRGNEGNEQNGTERANFTVGASEIETGVSLDEFGNTVICLAPTVFFSNRVKSAFPGLRGLHWFDDPREAIKRLELLLKPPLRFDEATAYGGVTDPVWWFRGYENMYIARFKKLRETRCLLDVYELEVSRVAVFHSDTYYRSFVYVEVHPDEPIGISDSTEKLIQETIHTIGCACEEYALYDGIPVSRTCYDDGAAVIDGEVTDIAGAELRVRYLSKYNLLIAAKFSPVNSPALDKSLQEKLNGILRGSSRLEEICHIMTESYRHEQDV